MFVRGVFKTSVWRVYPLTLRFTGHMCSLNVGRIVHNMRQRYGKPDRVWKTCVFKKTVHFDSDRLGNKSMRHCVSTTTREWSTVVDYYSHHKYQANGFQNISGGTILNFIGRALSLPTRLFIPDIKWTNQPICGFPYPVCNAL